MKLKQLIPVAAVLLLTAACKPTEAGYKAAYDAAQTKRAAEDADAAAYGGMVREGQPQWRMVGADSVLFIQQPLAPMEGDTVPMRTINVAVAAYKMNTNALSHAERLRAAGLDARVLKARRSTFVVIAAQCDSLTQAVPAIASYMKGHPDDMYSGLPGRPVVMAPSGRRVN